jgi:hypothetical protein
MNATEKRDHELHRTPEVILKDVWKDGPAPPIPTKLKTGKKNLTYGQARGNTWGYQSLTRRTRKLLDKFFYTGPVETVALSEVGDVTGRFGRVGIDLKTEIEVWVDRKWPGGIHGTNMPYTICHSETVGKRPREQYGEEVVNANHIKKKWDYWVRDHFGTAVGIKIRALTRQKFWEISLRVVKFKIPAFCDFKTSKNYKKTRQVRDAGEFFL